jgi:hypothetical protein
MRSPLIPPPHPRSLLCWYALRAGVTVLTYCVLLLLVLWALTGCRHIPTQQGGATGVAIDNRGVAVSTRLADSPREASEQTVTRTVRETFAAPPSACALPSPAPFQAPTGLTTHTSTQAPVLSRETQETVHTRVGASQDLAGILKATQQRWRTVAAVLSGLVALGLGYLLTRRDWVWVGLALAAGGLGSVLSGSFWGVGIGAAVAVALTLGYLRKAALA